jgi:hypothetical protein
MAQQTVVATDQSRIESIEKSLKGMQEELVDLRGLVEMLLHGPNASTDDCAIALQVGLAAYRDIVCQRGSQYRDLCGLLRNLQGREEGPLREILEAWLKD